nr:Na/Pi symporter [Methylonatrum kenyense]
MQFAGGLGLLLLGMRLMSEGLRVSAGDALRQILAACTGSRWRGLGSGVMITALVQSSSAVTFATVGFVNAGLLSVAQAISIIYGANVGTTLTSWLVALLGFNVNLQILALPAIAVGAALRIGASSRRRGPLGDALAGFGLFFIGIDILRLAFQDLGGSVDLGALALPGIAGVLIMLLIGIILTVLMQSSSAALALTLTAAAGGLVPLPAAAAMVIGANLGTTSTAVFAAIGATVNARRIALSHVVFNAVTAIVALATLPLQLWLASRAGGLLPGPAGIATTLAVFHTQTKLAGLAVIWPLTDRLVSWLHRRFRTTEEDLAKPEFLDRNVLRSPALALDAVALELQRTGNMANALLLDSLAGRDAALMPRRDALEQRLDYIAEFVNRLHDTDLPEALREALPLTLRTGQYQADIAERALDYRRQRRGRTAGADTSGTRDAWQWCERLAVAIGEHGDWGVGAETGVSDWANPLLNDYQHIKEKLLREGSQGSLPVRRMVNLLDELSTLRRALDQLTKGLHTLRTIRPDEKTESTEEVPPA